MKKPYPLGFYRARWIAREPKPLTVIHIKKYTAENDIYLYDVLDSFDEVTGPRRNIKHTGDFLREFKLQPLSEEEARLESLGA